MAKMAEVSSPSRGAVWRATGLVAAMAAAAIAAHARVVIVDWDTGGARRLAVFTAGAAPWAWAVGLAGVAAGVTWAARTWAGLTRAEILRAGTPLGLLALWLVPALPALPERWPMLLLLGGPLRWVVALVAVGLVCWRVGAFRRRVDAVVARVGPRVVLAAGAAVFVGLGVYVGGAQGLDGDEPHYLMIAQSLLADGDLAIENNYAAREFAAFSRRELRPPYLRRGFDGVIYSVHAPGLPVLLLPAYALAGARGAVAFLGLVAALTALAVYLLARDLAGPRAALAAWTGVALGTPFLFHGWLVFPEMAAACVTAWAALWIVRPPPANWRVWIVRGAALAALPWLHAKFAVLAAGLGVALGVRLLTSRSRANLMALGLPLAAGTVGWFAFFWALYGVADPTIPYGGAAAQGEQLAWANVPRGVLGLLVDQEYGVLVHAPFYLLVPAGFFVWLRRPDSRGAALALGLTALAFVISSTRYYMWWGGTSVPARFLVPVVPLVAPALAIGVASCRGAASRGMAAGLLLLTLLASIRLVIWPDEWLMFNERDGTGKLVEWVGDSSLLVAAMPSLLWRDWQAQAPGVLFVAGVVAAAWLGARLATWGPWRMGPPGAMVASGLGALAGASLLVPASSARLDTARLVREGRLQLLEALDGRRTTLIELRAWRGVGPEAALAIARLDYRPDELDEERRDGDAVVGPISLPPGRYDVQVWRDPRQAGRGRLAVTTRRGVVTLAATEVGIDNPTHVEIALPRDIVMTTLWVRASDASLARGITRVDVRPVVVVPRAGRGGAMTRGLGPVEGSPGAFFAHLDGFSYPEGAAFWTQGGRATALRLYPGRAQRVQVALQAGPAGGRAEVGVAGISEAVDLRAGEQQTIDVVLPGVESVPVRVSYSGGFRPSEVEPGSTDARWLGVRVSFALLP